MKLKTPSFWYRKARAAHWAEILLAPISWLYEIGHAIHHRFTAPYKADIPVICIGNLVAGGSGKTPTALALMALLRKHALFQNPFFLTRGYGGDEDKILSAQAPTIVHADRVAGAKAAKEQGADAIIMDDGLQNPSLHKDLKIVVIDGQMGLGNYKTLPAGPLRQPLEKGLIEANMFLMIGRDRHNVIEILPENTPVFWAILQSTQTPPADQTYLAFAGLGYPEKFFSFLRETLGLKIVETISFPDHYAYTARDIEQLSRKADILGATLITTEKDMVRIPESMRGDILTLPVELLFEDEDAVLSFIKNRVKP